MSSDFEIMTYDECDKDEWNQFVEESDDAWFWHTSFFLNAWPYGKNISFCIKQNNKIVLAQTLFFRGEVQKNGMHVMKWHHIPYITTKIYNRNTFSSIGGLARKYDFSSKQERKLQAIYLETIQSMIKEFQVGTYNYCIEATCSKAFWPEQCPLVNPLIFWGYKNKISQAYVIDLDQSEDAIFKGYVQTTRNLINRCKKNEEVRIVEAKPIQEDLDRYYDLHCETYNRTGVQPHPKSYFEKIFFEIIPAGYSHILFLYEGDRLLVAHNTLIYKDVAMYWTGCSVSDKGDGETRLLMHEQIMYAKRKKCKYFEVGECFPNVTDGKLKGLNDFKRSFGGMIHPIFSGEFL